MLAQALEIEPRGLFYAWRAQLAVIQHVEQHGFDKQELAERCRQFVREAMQREPMNSYVLSCVANAKLVMEGNLPACNELAKLSITKNPSNPMAWWSLSNARLYSGDRDYAYDAAKIAQQLAQDSPHRFWSDFQVSLTSAVVNRLDEAIGQGELAAILAPNFKPPLRYLTALYALNGDRDGAIRALLQLKSLEPDFSIDRMVRDSNYPVSMMRSSGLIDASKLSEIDDP